jgi:hypothetical protein
MLLQIAMPFMTSTYSTYAAAKTWTGGTSTSWNTAGNWSASGVPSTADTAIFTGTPTRNCDIDVAASVYKVRIASDFTGTLTQNATFSVTIGNGGFDMAGGTFTGGNKRILNDGSFVLSGGTFTSTSDTLLMRYEAVNRNFTQSGGTFAHNNGVLKFYGSTSAVFTMCSTIVNINSKLTLKHLVYDGSVFSDFHGTKVVITSNDTLRVTGNFEIKRSDNAMQYMHADGGVIQMEGDTVKCGAALGTYGGDQSSTTVLMIAGTSSPKYVYTGGTLPRLSINTTGTFSAATGTTELSADRFNLVSGTFSAPTGIFYINDSARAFVVSGGTFQHNDGTLYFYPQCGYSSTIQTKTVTIDVPSKLEIGSLRYGVRLSNAQYSALTYVISTNDTLKVTKNFTLSRSGTTLEGLYTNGGVIQFQGDTINCSYGNGGSTPVRGYATTKLLVNGTASHYYVHTGGSLPHLVVNTSGTLSPSSTTTSFSADRFTLLSGTFSAPTGYFNIGDSGAVFTVGGGTFTHNNGTLRFNNYVQNWKNDTVYINVQSKLTLGKLELSGNTGATATVRYNFSGDTLQITDTLLITKVANNLSLYMFNGVLEAQGNVIVNNCAGATNSMLFSGGATTQTLTYASTASKPTGTWEINKSSGSVVLASSIAFPSKLRITSGTLSQDSTFNLQTGDSLIVNTNGFYSNTGRGWITLGGPLYNTGRVFIKSFGGSCGAADSIFIRSSINGTRRNWGGSGVFSITDVRVRDMSSTPAITVYGSTDSLNNTANWTIDANCYVPVITNIRPAAAKRTAIITMNGDNFLSAQNMGQIVIGTIGLGKAQSWSNSVIIDTVPVTAVLGSNNAIITNNAIGKDTIIVRVTNPGITVP